MKCSAPAYFIYDEKFTISGCIPPVPEDKKDWEEYLLHIYDITLSSLFDIQRLQFKQQHSKQLTPYNYKVVDLYFKKLHYILTIPHPSKEASRQSTLCKKPIITMLREAFKRAH